MTPTPETCVEPLSAREFEVVRHVIEGLTNGEIADALAITERTVQAHVAAARRKLGARSRTHLAVRALRLRLLPLDDEEGVRRLSPDNLDVRQVPNAD